jgi:DNA recombination protein RmuC
MPIEGAYELAISEDERLLSDAYQANVLIVSPTNVLSILKFAEIAYRNEAFAKNLKELYNTGRLLHQRVELFSERFEKLGNKIVGLQKDFDDTKKTLSQGSRSVLETANRFIEKSKNANIDFEEEKDDE